MRRIVGRHPLGLWLASACIAFAVLVGGGGQGLSLLDWDLALRLGLQEHDPSSPDLVQRVLAQVEWGVCLADSLLVTPLLAAGLVGLLCRRTWGWGAALLGACCWVYLFSVYVAQRYALVVRAGLGQWSDYADSLGAFALLILVPLLVALWGLVANADRFVRPCPNSHRLRRRQDTLAPFAVEDLLICTGQVLWALPQVWIGGRRTWNTRPGEAERPLAGDDWVGGGTRAHRAITIARPPASVWPWVAQFGRGAGYYSWDFLDNPGHRHADYLVGAPAPRVGDWNQELGEVGYLEPGTELVWYAEPRFFGLQGRSAIGFRLDPEPDGATRLHFYLAFNLAGTGLRPWIATRLALFMDHVMSTEMLRRLKLLIETYEERLGTDELNRPLAPHQGTPWRAAGVPESVPGA